MAEHHPISLNSFIFLPVMEIQIRVLYWFWGGWQDLLGEEKGLMIVLHWKINSYIWGRFYHCCYYYLYLYHHIRLTHMKTWYYFWETAFQITKFLFSPLLIVNSMVHMFYITKCLIQVLILLLGKSGILDIPFEFPHVRNKANCIIVKDLWKELNEIILMFFLP